MYESELASLCYRHARPKHGYERNRASSTNNCAERYAVEPYGERCKVRCLLSASVTLSKSSGNSAA